MDWFSTLIGLGIGLVLIALRGRSGGNLPLNATPHRSEVPSTQESLPSARKSDEMQAAQVAYYAALDLAQFKGGFLSRTSHELRSPLNALISSLQMIQAGLCDDPEEEKEYVGLAHDGAMKFIGMLDEVLKVSKLQSGRLDLAIEKVDLAIVLQEVYFMTRHLAANRNLKLDIPFLEDEIWVQADPNYLQQALTILVSRSIEAMEEGTIALTLSADPAQDHSDDPIVLTLTDQLSAAQWSETQSVLTQANPTLPPIPDLSSTGAIVIPTQFSPAFRLLLAKELLLLMGIPLTSVSPIDPIDPIASKSSPESTHQNHPLQSIHSIQCRFERATP